MNNGHLSASERRILALESHIAQLEESRAEYALVLNYLVYHSLPEQYVIHRNKMQDMMKAQHGKLRVIRSEITPSGDMVWTYGDEPPKEASLIISPAS